MIKKQLEKVLDEIILWSDKNSNTGGDVPLSELIKFIEKYKTKENQQPLIKGKTKCEFCGKIYVENTKVGFIRFYYLCNKCEIKFEKDKKRWKIQNRKIVKNLGIKENESGDYCYGKGYITWEMVELLPTNEFKKELKFLMPLDKL